mmetsp:Transcript_12156/g.18144  ORF Transcript_12156/g.18144 Transcript_12156/m.18144 type:complete len:368 (+) Transcript_12156:77-1180(+)|eukprot:CAMPEP_0167770386 /NCGR_PEP_ID=MMETSP0110_2-20121227/17903_1 /TAXON_ID=629695 /ORGANISM="Gymnochlora sp., Strain CCMP2014" /LENGTH=367 /DNA_ID=CAMNT_0007659583 /DNA_START=54 /DNA_END=1157 /DNA_ORIENTATION=+
MTSMEIETKGKPVFGDAKKGAKQWQEDSYVHYVSKSGNVFILAVFDGHGGYNGLVASNTARDTLMNHYKSKSSEIESWDSKQWQKDLGDLFATIHNAIRDEFINQTNSGIRKATGRVKDSNGIVRSSSGDPVHGGTTGSVVVAFREKDGTFTVIGANVGDSTALMISEDGNFEFISEDHGPDSEQEYKRVQSLDEKAYPEKLIFVYDKAKCYKKYECPRVFLSSGKKDPKYVENPWGHGLHPTNVRYEPAVYAVTPQNITRDATCIAMTRALGDFYAAQFGLSPIPSFIIKKTKKDTRYLLAVASDGIWDCWKYEEFSKYACALWREKGLDVKETVQTALSESVSKAITNFGSSHYDDASLVMSCIE